MKFTKFARRLLIRVGEIVSHKLWLAVSLISVVFILSGAFIYFQSEKKAETSLSEQTLHRQQVIARAGAKSIEISY